jgi:hypothetical protein
VWCLLGKSSIQNDLLQENIFGTMMYNNIMDNVAEDALQNCVIYEDYQPKLKPETITDYITHELSDSYMGMGNDFSEYLKNCIKLVVVTDTDGFYMAGAKAGEEFVWSGKIYYTEGKITKQEEKVNQIVGMGEEKYGITLLLPNGDGTGLINSIDDYQLLLVYETYPMTFYGKKYGKLLLSGAKVSHEIQFTP